MGGLIGAVASAATEVADDRMWRMLPGRVYIARGYLPPGEHVVTVNGRALPDPVKIDGQYALVPLRLYENTVLMGSVASLGKLAPASAAPVEVAAPAAPAAKPAPRANTRTATRPAKPVAKSPVAAPTPAAKN